MSHPLRMGFPVKVLGREIKSNDTRRWQSNPHLKVSLEYVDQILDYLKLRKIEMYRLSSDLAPYATHPDMPQFHKMVEESDPELQAIGKKARELGIRLSFHPSQFVLLNSPDETLTRKSIWDLSSQAEMLDRMGLGDEAVMVTHVGGVYGDPVQSRARWAERWPRLPEHVRRRLVLENDDIRFSAADVLWVHEQTGVRCVFDYQHCWCLNPEGLDMVDALKRILATWPEGQRPKIHFSTPRMEMRELVRQDKKTKKKTTTLAPPVITNHSDFTNPFEFARFMRDADGLEFDVMLESKSKDLALLKLRSDLLRFAPDVAARFGLTPADAPALPDDEALSIDEAALDDADPDEGARRLPEEPRPFA
ncbi:UV DNA damage repair endonuclease UvsE [Phenylobacterium deserti]|uniref:UV DNA damage repair endonuclease UvsE n=1 Tax=Phenylobacterium deserti TaxID=1914756 RepID=A0A328AAA6_9CAUL|nr:UV DNA damage repair endonuclease UvsE [Phenylobacterium deserti]RAK51531.1 UV DNA damage repair endonuclease UvsE [Phenylobacterium deserti]